MKWIAAGSSQHGNKTVASTHSSQILNQLTTYQLVTYLVHTLMKKYKFHILQWLPTYYSWKFFENLPTISDFKNPLGTKVVHFILHVITPWHKNELHTKTVKVTKILRLWIWCLAGFKRYHLSEKNDKALVSHPCWTPAILQNSALKNLSTNKFKFTVTHAYSLFSLVLILYSHHFILPFLCFLPTCTLNPPLAMNYRLAFYKNHTTKTIFPLEVFSKWQIYTE